MKPSKRIEQVLNEGNDVNDIVSYSLAAISVILDEMDERFKKLENPKDLAYQQASLYKLNLPEEKPQERWKPEEGEEYHFFFYDGTVGKGIYDPKDTSNFLAKQDSHFYWLTNGEKYGGWQLADSTKGHKLSQDDICSAFTVAELGEMLPHFINRNSVFVGQLMTWKNPNDHCVSYGTMKDIFCKETSDTEADARGKMLIYLLENNLITLN